jgi:hypothetical protein
MAGRSPLSRGAIAGVHFGVQYRSFEPLVGANRLTKQRFARRIPAGILWCRKRDLNPSRA